MKRPARRRRSDRDRSTLGSSDAIERGPPPVTVTGPVALQADELDRADPGASCPSSSEVLPPSAASESRRPRQALFYLPFRYDDFSELRSLGELVPDEKQSAAVRVTDVKVEAGFGRRPQRVIAQLADDSGSAEAIWFGRRYVERRLQVGRRDRPQRQGDDARLAAAVHIARLHAGRARVDAHRARGPGLPLDRGRHPEAAARAAGAHPGASASARSTTRSPPTSEDRCPCWPTRCATAHFPEEATDVAAGTRPARVRRAARPAAHPGPGARRSRRAAGSPRITVDAAERAALVEALPFELTGDQARAVDEVLGDLGGGAADAPPPAGGRGQWQDRGRRGRAGGRGARRLAGRAHGAHRDPRPPAPRKAWRHCSRALGVRAEFLSGLAEGARGGASPRRACEAAMAEVVIGTHAVISEGGRASARLGLAVVDEQHRFGVAQRAALQAKGERPASRTSWR